MNAWIFTRLSLCLLVVNFATGCGLTRGFRSDPIIPVDPGNTNPAPNPAPNPVPNPPNASAADTFPGGTVVAAGGPVSVPQAPPTLPPPAALPPPRPLPAPPGWPPGVPVPPNGQQPPLMMPSVGVPGGAGPSQFADPHLRGNPTVTGGRLGLAPYEVPTDRVVELTRQLDLLLAQNRDLSVRIKELEGLGVVREQAIAEAMREIDTVTAEAGKSRAASQLQVAALQAKIKQLEEDDILFLRLVIDALGKLLPSEKKP